VAKANVCGVISHVEVWTKKHVELVAPCFAQRMDKRVDMAKLKGNVEAHVRSCGPRGNANHAKAMSYSTRRWVELVMWWETRSIGGKDLGWAVTSVLHTSLRTKTLDYCGIFEKMLLNANSKIHLIFRIYFS
jgi:hypothetical protein